MPRYFFDLEDGKKVRDEVGRLLFDDTQLAAEVRTVVGEQIAKFENDANIAFVVNVRDEADNILVTCRVVCQFEHHGLNLQHLAF